MASPLNEKSIFIHNVYDTFGGNYPRILAWLKNGGFATVLVKAAEGAFEFRPKGSPNLTAAFVQLMHLNGIQVIGWQFCYGTGDNEGLIAAQLCDRLGLDGWAFDVEEQFENHKDAVGRAGQMIGTFNKTVLKKIPLGFCSWAFYWNRTTGAQIHRPELARFMMEWCDVIMSMAYWSKLNWLRQPLPMTNREVLDYCKDSLNQQKKITTKPIVMILRAYTGDGNVVLPDNVLSAGVWARLAAYGVSWWDMDHAARSQDITTALMATPGWEVQVDPDPEEPPVLGETQPAIPGPFDVVWPAGEFEERFKDAKLDAYPATVPVMTGRGMVYMTPAWQTAFRALMTAIQWKETWKDEKGYHNRPHGPEGVGVVGQLTFVGSRVWVKGINPDGRLEVDAYYNDETPPNLKTTPDPYRINTFSVMGRDGKLFYDDKGKLPTLIMANDRTENLRIYPKYLKSRVSLPLAVKVKTDGDKLNVRDVPSTGKVVTQFSNGTSIVIFELRKIGNGIWGRCTAPGSLPGWCAMWYTDWAG